MGRLFGTDGVRGVANTHELDSILAYKLGRAGSYVLSKKNNHKSVIFVGKDTRASGDMLEGALIAGICSTGARAVRLGVLPTPAVAYLTRKYGADAGVVISASHNPVEFNGIKFFDRDGHKLNDAIEEEIEDIILNNSQDVPFPTGADVGFCETLDTAVDEYVEFATSTIDCRLDGLTIALDCACGASYQSSPKAFRALGATVHVTGDLPDGSNINAGCGSTHLDNLQKFVKETGCDFGLAFDGDADRMLAVDHEGNYIDGDQIMAACALNLKTLGKLSNNTIVATVMSNMGLFLFGKQNGIEVLKTKVGDRYVLEKMLADGYSLGGEQSGHIIFLDHNTTGDGLVSALQLASIVSKTGKSLKEICSVMKVMPQVLYGAKVENSKKHLFETDPEITEKIAAAEKILGDSGRVLIRPSGTEPLVRVMIEGEDTEQIDKMAKELTELIERKSK